MDHDRARVRLDVLARQLRFMRDRPGVPFCTQYTYFDTTGVEIDVLPADGCLLPDEIARTVQTAGSYTVDIIVCSARGTPLHLCTPFYSSHRWLAGLQVVLGDLPHDVLQWDLPDVDRRLQAEFPAGYSESHG